MLGAAPGLRIAAVPITDPDAARLVEELGVSEDTIRRDLRELAAHGLVQRVHGGALAPAPQPGTFAHRAETCTEEKAALA